MSTSGTITAAVLLAAGAFIAGNLTHWRPAGSASPTSSRPVLYWACPMHPQYRSSHAGDCPACGMRLEPAYAGDRSKTDADSQGSPGPVEVSAAKQQLTGVRTEVVQRASSSNALRVYGRIAVDESRLSRLIAASDGWVQELGSNPAGTRVKKDQVLASYFARDLLSAQQNYLYAYQVNAQSGQQQANYVPQRASASLNLRSALDVLRSLGMSNPQIEELQRTGEPKPELSVYSPITGFVLARNISPGQRFDKGYELYRIADITRVWVTADIFERDREFLKPGAVSIVRYRDREFRAVMSDSLPQFDAQSRTFKARFELDNSSLFFQPDMFVDIELSMKVPPAVLAPADALIESGRRHTIFVESSAGYFEPRLVETGRRLGDRVEITKGLDPGERIVVAGNFLIDSESRMNLQTAEAGAAQGSASRLKLDSNAPNALAARR